MSQHNVPKIVLLFALSFVAWLGMTLLNEGNSFWLVLFALLGCVFFVAGLLPIIIKIANKTKDDV